jgi:hypothetical protein
MARNKINDLRNHLFEVIEMLKDEEPNSMTIEKAETIAQVAQVIINTGKLETDYIRATDGVRRTNYETQFLNQNLLDNENEN